MYFMHIIHQILCLYRRTSNITFLYLLLFKIFDKNEKITDSELVESKYFQNQIC
jgi:hypothetical protein